MTNPKDDDAKRYYAEQITLSTYEVYEEKVDGLSDDYIEFVRAADHDRVVAELATARKVIEKLKEQRDDWISACILNDPNVEDEESTIANYIEADNSEIEAIERGEK